MIKTNIDYNRPVMLADNVYWVGRYDKAIGFASNPYLIVEDGEAVLIDGGSRPDFSTVMRKILQAGAAPGAISHLIYHHYDPDLCGSLPNLEDMIDNPALKVVSKQENNSFIRHYGGRLEPHCIDEMGRELILKSGRRLRFIPTPYAHSSGSFMTWDEKSGVLFSSDLFGGLGNGSDWMLFLSLDAVCHDCQQSIPKGAQDLCATVNTPCPLSGLANFHRKVMPSNAALRFSLEKVQELDPEMIASQHGSVLCGKAVIGIVIRKLMALDDVGIDGVLKEIAGA
ncbi:MAG: MBL fold metallo-hydrolase [Magnetococcales bacterium]|nr:MBL fold metallo-hydrolase [Magnetococcales bacterium]